MAGARILLGGLTQSGPTLAWLDWESGSGALPLPEGAEYLYALCPDAAGGFCLMSAYGVVLVDDTGAERRTLEAGSDSDWHFSAMELRENSLYVLADNSWDEEPPELRRLDGQTLELQETLAMDEQTVGLGQAADGTLLVNTTDGIFTLSFEGGQSEAVLSWSVLGFSASAEQISACEQGYVLFARDDRQLKLLRWEDGAAPERTVLTMAIPSDIPLQGFGITELIEDFNRSQPLSQRTLTAPQGGQKPRRKGF